MKNEQKKNWQEIFLEKVREGWSRIDRFKFQKQFMMCQYEDVISKFDEHGEPFNDRAMRDYFNKIRRGEQPATDEAQKFAEVFFQINRQNVW